GADRPEFGTLFARIRDRVSTLRALYGDGPLEIDFKSMGERAARIRMTCCEIRRVDAERTSRATGQRHSLGGFVGKAEYEGDLAEFLPYLEIARWTGVGRQAVWGKGEIVCEIL
ncbi:MAG TPA: CRISPR system precrRNA processing endoribonuclease RAMP protein Cas6, partial [Bryobacteraceae bacterium]|nr:CRISPR system precrRNA processing endoribonuclease RAMP protein Cas6 [Bryobacteraceae bacterium]